MQETKRKIKNPRKLLLYILLGVILPLAILASVAVSFYFEGKKFKFKINNKDVTYDKRDFSKLSDYGYEFEKLAINDAKYYTTYKNKDDEKDGQNHTGYELEFQLEAKLKNNQDIYNLSDGIQCYAVVSLPGYKKNGLVVDKNSKISKDETTTRFSSMRITKPLPHHYPFLFPIKDVVVYFILRVPYTKQERVKLEELKKGKSLTKEEKEKYTEYREFKFYWNFTQNTPKADQKTKVR